MRDHNGVVQRNRCAEAFVEVEPRDDGLGSLCLPAVRDQLKALLLLKAERDADHAQMEAAILTIERTNAEANGYHEQWCRAEDVVKKFADERDTARAEVAALKQSGPMCRQCGARVEVARWCYATPMCFKCLPPPPPLPILEMPK